MPGTVGGRVRWAFCAAKGSLRETSDPSGTAQNEQNNKPWTLVPGDQISAIIRRGFKYLVFSLYESYMNDS